MNWAHDNAFLSRNEADLRRIFKYEPQASTAIKIVRNNSFRMQIWSLGTESDWSQWMQNELSPETSDSGLVLILAKRSGEKSVRDRTSRAMSYEQWNDFVEADSNPKIEVRRTQTFAALSEKALAPDDSERNAPPRQPGIRVLPFSYDSFKLICESFYVHESIVKTIARTDVPSFSCENVQMGQRTHIYNCRTSNSWPSDMALSATHFPEKGLSYAVLYGCTATTEESMLKRLNKVTDEACHPLLIPGIFAELELIRHISLVEASIVEVETKIFQLDFESGAIESPERTETERRKEGKRTTWLDLTYLRNSLITWNCQVKKMLIKAENSEGTRANSLCNYIITEHTREGTYGHDISGSMGSQRSSFDDTRDYDKPPRYVIDNDSNAFGSKRMKEVGAKIRSRLANIHEENAEKIRDCTMRVDGMAMATQWSHSETAVEMALATNRESRVMKSISLVTMVFLPGTFFATVFSMSFFNWFGINGKSRVSSYLWVYVAVTVSFTAITIGLWYFFVIYRRPRGEIVDEEKKI